MGTLLHPANSIYGFLAGAALGGTVTSMYEYSYPKNFELKIKNVDEKRRRALLREDEEFELSHRNFLKITTNLYPL